MAITFTIFAKEDRSEAAKTWVPLYVGLMTWAFSSYLLMKGFKNLFKQYDIFTLALIITV